MSTFIEYRSVTDLNNSILHNIHKLPHNIDIVVGIPRSGMLPATLIALYLHKPLTDIDSFVEGKIFTGGGRIPCNQPESTGETALKVLVVDDSILGGNALAKAKQKLATVSSKYELLYGVVYATTSSYNKVDFYCETIDSKRIFQWNMFNHPSYTPVSCYDMDGVLCQDPPIDDDGPIYTEFIKNAPALYIPSQEIGCIVTCRLEKYRKITEDWLSRNNVKYKKLVMLNLESKQERVAWGKHGEYKGLTYKQSDNILFFESSLEQARIISKVSGKPVICTENFSIIYKDEKFDRLIDNGMRKADAMHLGRVSNLLSRIIRFLKI